MNPAFSVVVFTTMAGLAQGLATAMAVAVFTDVTLSPQMLAAGLSLSLALLVFALAASFLHLGRPERAWRAVLMWRTSWLSREVIVLPLLIGLIALWFVVAVWGGPSAWRDRILPLAVLVTSVALWYCTAMIYACLRFIEEWAHSLTIFNFLMIGLSSGLILFGALLWLTGDTGRVAPTAAWALAATLVALAGRVASIRRNQRLVPTSTLQSAIGVADPALRQTSMGMTGGSFNTREFQHGLPDLLVGKVRWIAIVLGFVVPALLLVIVLSGAGGGWLALAVPLQYAGLLAERWFFFAQARHPQNLYYQKVS